MLGQLRLGSYFLVELTSGKAGILMPILHPDMASSSRMSCMVKVTTPVKHAPLEFVLIKYFANETQMQCRALSLHMTLLLDHI